MGPEDLIIDAYGNPQRIDKAFSWEAPLANHGLMHMLIKNAWAGDPYKIDTLFMYMANMAWNSAMNTAETMRMLTDKDADGEYKIPRIIYSDAFYSEMVAYADLILPDTTYLERWDCISILDRPIGKVDGPADSIRQPILMPDRDVRPFQDVLIDLGARLGLPAFVNAEGGPRYPAGYKDYLTYHERAPGIGPLAGWRGENGEAHGKGAPNPDQLQRYIDNGCFWKYELPEEQHYYKHANRAYLDNRSGDGAYRQRRPDHPAALRRAAAEVPARGAGAWRRSCRRRAAASSGSRPISTRCRSGTRHSRGARVDTQTFPFNAVTQRPMPMYHSWGSQNAWLRQILGANRLFMNRITANALGVAGRRLGVGVEPAGRIRAQLKLMEASTPTRCGPGTRSASVPERGASPPDSPEFSRGFLLNHLIAETLPGDAAGNADPITGQAAWYDLRVRVEKAPAVEAGESAPHFATAPPSAVAAAQPRYIALWRTIPMTDLPPPGAKKLGLVIDLDVCVGCHACATACKEWNSGGHSAPLPDFNPYGADPWGVWFNRVHSFEEGEGDDARTVHFPRSCLHCEEPACVTVCPTGASYKRAEDGIVLVNADICIGCKLCSWACPYGAREFDEDAGVMKKCTLCIDRIYNDNLAENERVPACVMVCPTQRAAFRRSRRPELGRIGDGRRARRAWI